MSYTLIIGNNFIKNSPKIIKKDNNNLFEIKEDALGPYINASIQDANEHKKIAIIEGNLCIFKAEDLVLKKNDRHHVLLLNRDGDIVLESRIVDKTTIIVSGIFSYDSETLIITQNYIILPSKKWIMHSKVNANYSNITISEKGISSS